MDSGHYAPPRAPVADAPVLETPPRAMAIVSVALVAVAAVLALVGLIQLIAAARTGEVAPWLLLLPAVEFMILAGVALLLWKRKGWARWLLLAYAVSQLCLVLISAYMDARLRATAGVAWNPSMYAHFLIAPGCLAAATLLVFGPARTWFRRQS